MTARIGYRSLNVDHASCRDISALENNKSEKSGKTKTATKQLSIAAVDSYFDKADHLSSLYPFSTMLNASVLLEGNSTVIFLKSPSSPLKNQQTRMVLSGYIP